MLILPPSSFAFFLNNSITADSDNCDPTEYCLGGPECPANVVSVDYCAASDGIFGGDSPASTCFIGKTINVGTSMRFLKLVDASPFTASGCSSEHMQASFSLLSLIHI